mgnify:FL=1
MFDSYFKYEDDQLILTKPFIETDNIYSICTTVQDYLCKIREMRSGQLVLPYSGGIDSSFLLLCYQECIHQGRLSKNDYEIISFDFTPENQPDKIKYWFAKTYLDLDINYIPITIDEQFIKKLFLNVYNLSYVCWQLGVNTQIFCFSQFPNKTFIMFDVVFVINYRAFPAGISHVVNDYNVINLFSYYECAKSSWIRNGYLTLAPPPQDIFQLDTNIAFNCYFNVPKFQYIMCYPQLYSLFPKRLTLANLKSEDSRKVYNFWNEFKKRSDIRFEHPVSAYLPNGERITSVEQTQEFFNRHS